MAITAWGRGSDRGKLHIAVNGDLRETLCGLYGGTARVLSAVAGHVATCKKCVAKHGKGGLTRASGAQ